LPARTMPTDPAFYAIVPELGPKPGDLLVTKRNWSAFYGTELDLQLRRRGVDSTARAAYERGFNVTIPTDAVTDMDPTAHDFALTKIFPRLAETGTTEAVLG